MLRRLYIGVVSLGLAFAAMIANALPSYAMSQVIIGGYADALSASATEYNSLQGGQTWFSLTNYRNQVIPTGGTFSRLSVELSTNPGTSTDAYTITLVVNGTPSALAVTFGAADTQQIDVTHTVDVVAGDYIYLQSSKTSTPDNTPTATWSIVFAGSTANESILLGINQGKTTATSYATLQGANGSFGGNGTESFFYQIIPTGGTIKKLYAKLDADPGTAPDDYLIKLRVNGGDSNDGSGNPLAVTIVADNTTGNDTTHTISVSAGDYVDLAIIPENTPSVAPIMGFGLTFVATTDGESLILGQSSDTPTNSQNEYNYLTSTSVSNAWSTTETFQGGQSPTNSMVLKNFYVKQEGTSGASKSWAYTIRGGGGSTNLTVSIAGGTDTTGSDTNAAHNYTVASYDDLAIMSVPTSTPTAQRVYWGVVCSVIASGTPSIANTPSSKDFGAIDPSTTYWASGSDPLLGSTALTKDPTAQTADGTGWTDPTYAYSSNNQYASATQGSSATAYAPTANTNGSIPWTNPTNAYAEDTSYATASPTYAATTSKNPTTNTNGTLPWTNPANAYTSENSYATVAPTYGATTSKNPTANSAGSGVQFTNPTQGYTSDNNYATAGTLITSGVLRPTGNDANTGAFTYSATNLYTSAGDNSDTTYITGVTNGGGYATFTFTAYSIPVNAQNITLHIVHRFRSDTSSNANNGGAEIKVGGSYYAGATGVPNVLAGAIIQTDTSWATNPNHASAAWTGTDINGTSSWPLQAFGVGGTDFNPDVRFYDVWTYVTYNYNDQVYKTFAITDPGTTSTITKVELGYEAFATATQKLNFFTSANGGSTWSSVHTTANLATSDPNAYTYVDVTADQTWTWTLLNDTNFQVQVDTNWVNGTPTFSIDALIVRVTYDDRRPYDQQYGTFALTDPLSGTGSTITKVELGYEAYASATGKLDFYTSSNGGGAWSGVHTTANLGTSDPNAYTYIEVTADYVWTWTLLNDTNLKIKMVTNFVSGTPAWSTDALVIRVTYDDRRVYDHIYGTYGITGSATITKVEVGYEAFSSVTGQLDIYTSANGGGAWSSTHNTGNLGTSDPGAITWIDVTADQTWTWTLLNDTNLKIKVGSKWISGTPAFSLDYLPVRVTANTAVPSTIYGTYGYSLTDAITKVEVGVEGYTSAGAAKNLAVYMSWNNGSNWSGKHTFSLPTSDPNSTTWVDVTADTTWTGTTLNDTNLKVKATHDAGDSSTEYIDYIPVRVTYTKTLTDGQSTFTITNDGAIGINITFKATNFTGGEGWLLGAPDGTHARLTTYISGNSTGTVLTTSEQQLIAALASSATKKWELKLETPTAAPADGTQKVSTITITASAS